MSDQYRDRAVAVLYAVTIFLSAFLLFQVQPLLGKFILPWFGGSPAVWTTCMLVFQVLLFAGYAYAHATTQYLKPGRQVFLHLGLLIVACALLPITPDPSWKPNAHDTPVWRIIFLTACTVGVPYFILSSTGPLVQGWFSRTLPTASPYRLYALSNLGSLLALLSYPFVVEPAFATPTQAILWSSLFGLFAILCAGCATVMWRTHRDALTPAASDSVAVSTEVIPAGPKDVAGLWFGLAMIPSVLLLAVTNQVCMDVAVIPFLWVLPLALYLLTFILAFDATGWYSRKWYSLAAAITGALTMMIMAQPPSGGLLMQLAIYFSMLFFCCMVCHGELVRLRPHPRFLTQYYLTISAGGAVGGLFVGLVAPVIFTGYYELNLALVGFMLLYIAVRMREDRPQMSLFTRWAQRLGGVGILCGAGLLITQMGSAVDDLAVKRNFYGVLSVRDFKPNDLELHQRKLIHGRIVHGAQFLAPEKKKWPTSYYGHRSGVGQLLLSTPAERPLKVGVIGLGTGTLAAYGRPGDQYRFYEINPDVTEFAQEYFSFLKDCSSDVTVVTGDARLVLEHEQPQEFDVLVIDAFSGDAIPVHLLTREALQVYSKHLRPDGVIACHISNLHFDLRPVLRGLADDLKWELQMCDAQGDPSRATTASWWGLMSRNGASLQFLTDKEAPSEKPAKKILWTDDRSNLFEVLR